MVFRRSTSTRSPSSLQRKRRGPAGQAERDERGTPAGQPEHRVSSSKGRFCRIDWPFRRDHCQGAETWHACNSPAVLNLRVCRRPAGGDDRGRRRVAHDAAGTDLLLAAATKTGGSLVHGLARTIDWTVVRRLASGSVPSAASRSLCCPASMFMEPQCATWSPRCSALHFW